MSFGTIYVAHYNLANGCTQNGESSYLASFDVPIAADSATVESPPAGVDSIAWNRMPRAVRRIIRELALKITANDTRCKIPEAGPVICETNTMLATWRIFELFQDANTRSLTDVRQLDRSALFSFYPRRYLTYSERMRVSSFAFGCALQKNLYYGQGLQGYLTPAEAEDYAAKFVGVYQGMTVDNHYRAIEPVMGELALSGAKNAREGNSCLTTAQEMLSRSQGQNVFIDNGLNIPSDGGGGGGGGGIIQFRGQYGVPQR